MCLPAGIGRFPQVSNIRFSFDPSRPVGSRILAAQVDGETLDNERIYVLATRGYMGRGKDGYRSLLVEPEGGECEEVVSEENGMLISAILRQYFMSLTVLAKWSGWCPSMDSHWYVTVPLFLRFLSVQCWNRTTQGKERENTTQS